MSNTTQTPCAAVIVDPYSSGRFFLYELKSRNMPIICIRSSLQVGHYFMRVYEAHKDYFVETIDFEDCAGLTELVDRLHELPYEVAGVLAGSEPGVELADRLAEALELPSANGTELTHARKDKAEMQDRLRCCGVPAAEQIRSSELGELVAWAQGRGQWPLVAKPVGSSGSDGIFFCQCEEDLAAAHTEVLGKVNPNGVVNTELVLQEFLSGDEYIVDTVSSGGRHLCVAMWICRKWRDLPWNPTAIMTTQNQLLPAEGDEQEQLASYVFRVLDAVGLKHGPCHTEVMLTPSGPRLVEVNCRMHGLQGPRLIELATGTSKATYAADVLIGEAELFNRLHSPPSGRWSGRWLYPLEKQCVNLVLVSPISGYLRKSIKAAIEAMKLPSVIEVLPAVHEAQFLAQSCDLSSAAGSVLMVHESEAQIEADIKRIRAAEESGLLYDVSPKPLPTSPPQSPKLRGSGEKGSPRLHSIEVSEEMWAAAGELPESAVEISGLDGEE